MSNLIAIHGKDTAIEMLSGGIWYPVLCGKDLSVEFIPEMVLITGPNSPARERMPRIEDWAVSVSGLTLIQNDVALDFFYMLQSAVRRALQSLRAKFKDAAGTTKALNFSAYVGRSIITGPISEFSQCTINFEVTGGLSDLVDPDPDPGVVSTLILSDWWQTSNGNTFINGASSGQTDGTSYTLQSTDKVQWVGLEGQQFDIVTGSPLAGTRTCQLDLVNHKINFPLTFDGSQRVQVIFQR